MADEYRDVITNQPLVIDNGSGSIKAGFAGEDQPKLHFPNFVGRPKHVRLMAGVLEEDFYVGQRAEELRGLLKLKYPMKNGLVNDWDDMERVWNYTFSELRVRSEEHPVLLTEAPLNPRKNREKSAEIFFETYNVPALFVSLTSVLSLYASGRTTGVVLDSGDGETHAVPIYEGFAIPTAIQRVDLAGRDISDYLQLLLRRCSGGYRFVTTAEKEIVRQIKETVCYVAGDPIKEEKLTADINYKLVDYKLPDGTIISIGPETFRAPEVLFRPDLIGEEYPGIHELVVTAINKTDIDLRKNLYANIVLSGGSTLFPGFGDRLLAEVFRLAPKDRKIKISAQPDRKFSAWVGGSILASLATFKKMWISHDEWAEDGAAIVHAKTF